MIIGATSLELVSMRHKFLAEGLSVSDNLLSIGFPRWLSSLEERSGNTRDRVVVWTTLTSREDRIVYALLKILSLIAVPAEEDQAGTRPAKGLMAGKRDSQRC